MGRLRVLEIIGAVLDHLAVSGVVAACPGLTDLALLGCECSNGSISFADLAFPMGGARIYKLDVQSIKKIFLRLPSMASPASSGTTARTIIRRTDGRQGRTTTNPRQARPS